MTRTEEDSLWWWLRPFAGCAIAMVGCLVVVLAFARPLGEAVGKGFVKAMEDAFKEFPPIVFPPDREPDPVVAPGAEGYIASLGTAGSQLHFHDDAGVTWIAVDAAMGPKTLRVPVVVYDGPPSRDVARYRNPAFLFFGPLTVRVRDAQGRLRAQARVSWMSEGEKEPVTAVADAGEVNLIVLPGKLSLWADDGPRCPVEIAWNERVSCTLDPKGLTVDTRVATGR